MGKMKKLTALLLAALLLTGCAEAETIRQTEASATEPSTDIAARATPEPVYMQTRYDPDFTVEEREQGIRRVIDGEGRELILVPRALEEIPEEYRSCQIVRVPLERAVFLTADPLCWFHDATPEILSAIAGVPGKEADFSMVAPVAAAIREGKIQNILNRQGKPDYDRIQALEPEVVFVRTGVRPQDYEIAELENRGIPYAVCNEADERDHMARLEWCRFLMAFFDADAAADAVMAQAQETVDRVKAAIAGRPGPRVAMFYVKDKLLHIPEETTWFGGILDDLGIVNVFAGQKQDSLSARDAEELVKSADIIVYTSPVTLFSGIPGVRRVFPELKATKAYEDNRVYQYKVPLDQNGDRTYLLLEELAKVFYPEAFPDQAPEHIVRLEKLY